MLVVTCWMMRNLSLNISISLTGPSQSALNIDLLMRKDFFEVIWIQSCNIAILFSDSPSKTIEMNTLIHTSKNGKPEHHYSKQKAHFIWNLRRQFVHLRKFIPKFYLTCSLFHQTKISEKRINSRKKEINWQKKIWFEVISAISNRSQSSFSSSVGAKYWSRFGLRMKKSNCLISLK